MSTEKSNWLKSLTHQQQLLFFITFSHGMTIAMRMICKINDDGLQERINALNEAHHAVCGQLLRINSGNESHDWLTFVINGIFLSKDALVRQQIDQAWLYAEHSLNDPERNLT
jgi:hypothetical protein